MNPWTTENYVYFKKHLNIQTQATVEGVSPQYHWPRVSICPSGICSHSVRLNQYCEQRSFRRSSPLQPWLWWIQSNTHTCTEIPSVTYWSVSLMESLASDVWHTGREAKVFIMENGGGKRRLLFFSSISHTQLRELWLARWWHVYSICHKSENSLFTQLWGHKTVMS